MNSVESTSDTQGVMGRTGYWVALVTAIVGGALSIELTKLHFVLKRDPSHESFCNLSETVNCDAVAKSAYSVLFGIPLSLWGMFAYSAAFGFALWGLRTRRQAPAALILLLGGVATAGALVLAYLSAFVIGSWCLLCAVSWGVDVTLLMTGFFMVKGDFLTCVADVVSYVKSHVLSVVILALVAVLALGVTAKSVATYEGHPSKPSSNGFTANAAQAPKTGMTAAGNPYIGAAKPKLLIEEYSDYQCPFCSKAHAQLRALVARYPEDIQVVHRHFPLDNDCNPAIPRPFHTHACYYAKLAVCAAVLNRFWQANDFLFHHGHDESVVAAETLARELGVSGEDLRNCLSTKASALLKPDIDEGIRLKIDGTPTFVIDGEKVTGALPSWVLEKYPLPN